MASATITLTTTYGGRSDVTLKWHEADTTTQYADLLVADISSLPDEVTAYHCGETVTVARDDITTYSYQVTGET